MVYALFSEHIRSAIPNLMRVLPQQKWVKEVRDLSNRLQLDMLWLDMNEVHSNY